MAYQHILVATGGSEHSHKAEAEALKLALAFGSHLSAIAVVQPTTAENAMGMTIELEQRQQNLERYRDHCREAGLAVDITQELGHPGEVIIRFAKQHQCDLIVLGRRRLSLAATVVLGSVSDYVLRRAACPVLIVQ